MPEYVIGFFAALSLGGATLILMAKTARVRTTRVVLIVLVLWESDERRVRILERLPAWYVGCGMHSQKELLPVVHSSCMQRCSMWRSGMHRCRNMRFVTRVTVGVVTTSNPAYTATELAHQFGDSGATHFVTCDAYKDTVIK
eukprot:2290214-Pleurochrysis_carterae.AAC.1